MTVPNVVGGTTTAGTMTFQIRLWVFWARRIGCWLASLTLTGGAGGVVHNACPIRLCERRWTLRWCCWSASRTDTGLKTTEAPTTGGVRWL